MPDTNANGAENGTIRFLLDDTVHEVANVAPTTTVLNYLREDLQRTGTKEGCAEGDCGACTVVVADLDGQQVRFRSVNSCIQFLPTLNGKALYTVESLKKLGRNGLHPVQQAMVDCHGFPVRLLYSGVRHVAVCPVQEQRRAEPGGDR